MASEPSSKEPASEEYLVYDLQKTYEALEEKGDRLSRPIHSRDRLDEHRKNFKRIELVNSDEELTAQFFVKDIFGVEISISLEKDPETKMRTLRVEGYELTSTLILEPRDQIQTHVKGLMGLARPDDKYSEILRTKNLQVWNLTYIQRRCPFYFDIRFRNDVVQHSSEADIKKVLPQSWGEWHRSVVHQKLVSGLKEYAKKIPDVTKVLCYGCGFLSACEREHDRRFHIQHMAAFTIARWLEELQGHEVKIYAQEPQYQKACKELMKQQMGITAVDWKDAELLNLVDEHSIIVSIGATGGPIVEPAIDITNPHGPAGIFYNKILRNSEDKWYKVKHSGSLPDPELGEECDRVWKWKQNCWHIDITDSQWLGLPLERIPVEQPRVLKDDQGRAVRGDDGRVIYDPKGPQKWKDGDEFYEKFDTELLLKMMPEKEPDTNKFQTVLKRSKKLLEQALLEACQPS